MYYKFIQSFNFSLSNVFLEPFLLEQVIDVCELFQLCMYSSVVYLAIL